MAENGRGTHTRIPTGAYTPAFSSHRKSSQVLARASEPHFVDVLVVGAGQAGLCAAYELRKRGCVGYAGSSGVADSLGVPAVSFVILDAAVRPGGAWQHRWPSLTMERVNHIADLPSMPLLEADPLAEAADVVPAYFSAFEEACDFPIFRPVHVENVRSEDPVLRVETTGGTFCCRVLINCTGTWTRPFIPNVAGQADFRGRQFHSQNFPGAREFEGRKVMVVGGGMSALAHLDDLGGVAKNTYWVTRTAPRWRAEGLTSEGLTPEGGAAVEDRVRKRVEAGLRPLPVVAETGLPVSPWTRSLEERGLLNRKPMFEKLTPFGAQWKDGASRNFDAIVWATGFRAELAHLAPLGLRSSRGGILMEGTRAGADPRVHLIGYGPSASTVGAKWAARRAVSEIVEFLGAK